jgi:hypothetical protein
MIARLEGTKDIKCVLDVLLGLNYEVVTQDNKIGFIYRDKLTGDDLKRDVKSAKDACKFTSSIKCLYGTSSASY